MPAKKLTARTQFVAEVGGSTVVVLPGARFSEDDPIVQAHRAQFDPPPKPKSPKARVGLVR
jgi:hypothetical protein